MEGELDFTTLPHVVTAAVSVGDGQVRKDVTAEVNGRRVTVALWVPEFSDDGLPRAQSTAAEPRRQHPRGVLGSGSANVIVPMQGTIVKVTSKSANRWKPATPS